jgi:iron-sulfur cluster assembly protein
MFEVTEKALDKLIELRTNPTDVLIISIRAQGCSGLGYHMEWQDYKVPYDKPLLNDFILSFSIGTDNKSFLFLEHVTLGYEDGLNGKGFVWINSKSVRNCGCGQSFAV